MRDSIIIVSSFVLGVLLILFNLLPDIFYSYNYSDISNFLLYILLFFVGVGVGLDKSIIQTIKNLNRKLLILPIVSYLSTIVGAIIGFYILDLFNIYSLNLKEVITIDSGMGYYSITAILISQEWGAELGSIALIVNLMREIFTILFAPFLSKFFGKFAITVSAGATAIDTSLPMIIKNDGNSMFPIAAYCGMFFTIIVPLLISLLLSI